MTPVINSPVSCQLYNYNDDYAPQRARHASLPRTTARTFGDRAFAGAGLGLWNSLLPHLRDDDLPYSQFRQSLKTFLFGQWGHGAVQTILTVPSRNNLTYLLT